MEKKSQHGWFGFSTPVLQVPDDIMKGSERGGYLHFEVDIPGVKSAQIAVYLSPALTSLLLELAKAYDDDRKCPEPARGWCQAESLAEKRYIDPRTVWSYLSQIRRRIRNEVRSTSEDLPIPKMFKTRRKSGVRLTCPLRVERIR